MLCPTHGVQVQHANATLLFPKVGVHDCVRSQLRHRVEPFGRRCAVCCDLAGVGAVGMVVGVVGMVLRV